MNHSQLTGHVAIFIAMFLWALNIPAISSLYHVGFTPEEITFYRMVFAGIVFWMLSFFSRQEKTTGRDFFIILLSGVVGIFGTQYFFSVGLNMTSPIDTGIILTLPPVLVLLLSAIFYKESLTLHKIIGLLFGLGGALMIVLVQPGDHAVTGETKGIFYVLLCAFTNAMYLLLSKGVSGRYTPVTLLKWMFLWAALLSGIFLYKDTFAESTLARFSHPHVVSVFIFMLVFPTVISYLLIPVALHRLNAGTVSMYVYLIPIVATAVSIAAGQAALRWDQPVAALLIFIGVFFVTKQNHTAIKKTVPLQGQSSKSADDGTRTHTSQDTRS